MVYIVLRAIYPIGDYQMNKKIYSFADEVKRLKKKYKRADYDEIEKQELISELRKLRDEQEKFRVDNGLDEESKEFGGGGTWEPIMPKIGMDLSKQGLVGGDSLQYEELSSSILPTAISTGFNLVGNLVGARQARKRADAVDINLPRMAPEQISLAAEREALKRSYGTASNVALKNARDLSSPGGAYANQVGAISTLTDSLGTGLSDSFMREANQNALLRQQANATNAEIGSKEALVEAELKNRYLSQGDEYRDAAFSAIPMGLRDYREQRANDMLMSTLGKDYGLYSEVNPNETFREKLNRQLFGSKYKVMPREYINSLRK